MSEIPDGLFDKLLKARPVPSTKQLGAIGRALAEGIPKSDVETCPHCGGLVRTRAPVSRHLARVVTDWLATQ